MMMETAELLMKNVIKKTAPAFRKSRLMTVSVPQKIEKADSDAPSALKGDIIGSCVAFNKPHLPPFFGPFIIFSLLEVFNKDGDDK